MATVATEGARPWESRERQSALRSRVQISHILPIVFISLAHLLLDLTGWRGAAFELRAATLGLDVGLFLLALVMAWGFAFSLANWLTAPVRRLADSMGFVPGHTFLRAPSPRPWNEWEPVGWDLDLVARRMASLHRQARRGVEALIEVEAVRAGAARLLTSWGDFDPPPAPGPDAPAGEFWKRVRSGLAGRLRELSERSTTLAAKLSDCQRAERDLSEDLSEMTIQSESLFLEHSHKAVDAPDPGAPSSARDELRTSLESWSREARQALDGEAASRLDAWLEWSLHCLEEEGRNTATGDDERRTRIEAISRRLENLARKHGAVSREVEACHILAVEIQSALPAFKDEPSQET